MSRREHGTRSERQEHGAWEQHTGQRHSRRLLSSPNRLQQLPLPPAAPSRLSAAPQRAQRSPPAATTMRTCWTDTPGRPAMFMPRSMSMVSLSTCGGRRGRVCDAAEVQMSRCRERVCRQVRRGIKQQQGRCTGQMTQCRQLEAQHGRHVLAYRMILPHLNGLGVDGRLVGDEVHAALALLLLQTEVRCSRKGEKHGMLHAVHAK